jgi:peptidoglycan/xylan/chitin deacetylase (PgdA/CDA1 family)
MERGGVSPVNKLAVSVDVEDWYHVPTVSGAPFSPYQSAPDVLAAWDGEYDHLTEPTQRTLDLLDEVGVTATFFVVADVVENYPGLIADIADRGHEIGCHGMHHELAIHPDTKEPRFSRAAYRDRLAAAKSTLESAAGQEVVGFRAPSVYVGGWMLDAAEDVGFEYDSSVARNSLYNKTDQSLAGVGRTPYVPRRGALDPGGDRELVELPWPYLQVPRLRLPAAGGPLVRLFGRRLLQAGIRQSLERGDSVFYFHPIDIARQSFPDVGSADRRPLFWLFKGRVAERRIRALLASTSHELTTCADVARST